jgi:hypothetical protein
MVSNTGSGQPRGNAPNNGRFAQEFCYGMDARMFMDLIAPSVFADEDEGTWSNHESEQAEE